MATRFTGSQLDRRIQLQRPVVARDPAFGAVTTTWQTVATVWAKRVEQPGGTSTQAEQRVATGPVQYLIRYRNDVAGDWRVVEAGHKPCRLVGLPVEVGRRSGLLINAEETSDA